MDQKFPSLTKMEERIAFILMKAGVEPGEVDECVWWAFGPNAWYVPIYPDWFKIWNKTHPQYPIKKNESFVKFIFAVGIVFREYKDRMIASRINN